MKHEYNNWVCFFATYIFFSLSRTSLSWTHLQVIPALAAHEMLLHIWLSALCLCMFTETFDITNSCVCILDDLRSVTNGSSWSPSSLNDPSRPWTNIICHFSLSISPLLPLSSCGSCVAVLSVTSGVRLNIYSHKQHLLFTSWHWSSASSPGMAVRQSMKYIHPSVRTLSLGISIKICLCSI